MLVQVIATNSVGNWLPVTRHRRDSLFRPPLQHALLSSLPVYTLFDHLRPPHTAGPLPPAWM